MKCPHGTFNHSNYRNELGRYLQQRSGKYEFMNWLLRLMQKRGVKIVWLTEEDQHRLGVVGYANLLSIAIPSGCVLEDLIPVICHEIGHWMADTKKPCVKELFKYAIETKHPLPSVENQEHRWVNEPMGEEAAWRFAERLIKFYYRKEGIKC